MKPQRTVDVFSSKGPARFQQSWRHRNPLGAGRGAVSSAKPRGSGTAVPEDGRGEAAFLPRKRPRKAAAKSVPRTRGSELRGRTAIPRQPGALGRGATATSATSPARYGPSRGGQLPARPRLHRPRRGVRGRAPTARHSRPRQSRAPAGPFPSELPSTPLLPLPARPPQQDGGDQPRGGVATPARPLAPAAAPCSRGAHLPESGPSPRRSRSCPGRAAGATHLSCCVSSGRAGSGRSPCSSG